MVIGQFCGWYMVVGIGLDCMVMLLGLHSGWSMLDQNMALDCRGAIQGEVSGIVLD